MVSQSLAVLVLVAFMQTAPVSLLKNGNALQGSTGWNLYETVPNVVKTEIIEGVPCFTLRSPGVLQQVVDLPPATAGWYVALLGRAQTERRIRTGSITGLPYLHATVIAVNRRYFLEHWQGQELLARDADPGKWVAMSGLFRIPKGAAAISLRLKQGHRKGDPQHESVARFADVRMVLFPKESEARKYIGNYRKQAARSADN